MSKFFIVCIFLLSFCFTSIEMMAQAPQWEWSRSYGGSGSDVARKIAVDSRNGVYTYGTFTSTSFNIGSNSFNNNGGLDLFLVKHDTLGNVQWAKTFGGAGVDTVGSICTDRLGNIIITGSFSNTFSIGTYTFSSVGQKNIFVAKLNSAGNVLWAQQLNCSGDAIVTDIKTDITNSIYIVGNYRNGDLLFDNITLANGNTNNLFYSKLADNGAVVWAKKVSSNINNLKLSNIEFFNPSTLIIIGYGVAGAGEFGTIHFNPSDPFTVINLFNSSIFHVKLDTSGTFITQKQGVSVGSLATYLNSTIGNNNNILNSGIWRTLTNPNPSGLFHLCDSNFASRNALRASSMDNGTSLTQDVVYSKQKRSFFVGSSNSTINFGNGFMINEPGKNALFIAETDTALTTKNLLYAAAYDQLAGMGNFLSCDIDTLTNSLYVAGLVTTNMPPVQIGNDILVGNGGADLLVTKVNINGWNSATYSMNDTTICAGRSVGLGLTVQPSFGQGPYTYSWSPSTGLSSTNTIVTSATPTATTVYNLQVTDALSNSQVHAVTVNVIPLPAALTISAGGPLNFCQGGSVTLTASAGQNYLWSNGATTQSITVNTSGTYSVKDSSGTCTSPSSNIISVQVNPVPAKPTITASGPLTFCGGGNVTLTSSAGQNYTWSNGATTQSITVNASGTYSVKVAAAGCESPVSDNVAVQVNPVPAAPTISASGPLTFCAGGSVTLTSSTGQSYIWSNGATTQSITVNAGGTYSLKVSVAGCESPASFIVVVVNPVPAKPTVTAGGPLTFCEGASVTLTSGTAQSYIWSNGASTQSITVNASGTYFVKVATAGCESLPSDNMVVQVNPVPAKPTVTAGGPLTFCGGGAVTLTSSTGQNYIWSNGATTQSITVSATGNYSLKVAAAGCESSASTTTIVTVNANPPIPVITQHGNQLTSSAANGNQWYLGDIIINGATSSNYFYSTPGVYSVQVTNAAGCVAVSNNLAANRANGTISILHNGDEFLHLISPNPVRFSSTVEFNLRSSSKLSITLLNSDGKQVATLLSERTQTPGYFTIPLSNNIATLNNGIYYIVYRINGELVTDRFVIGR